MKSKIVMLPARQQVLAENEEIQAPHISSISVFLCIVQRIAKGAGGKGAHQKMSKSIKTDFDISRQFSCRAKSLKYRQIVSKVIIDNVRAAPIFWPL